jgi:hypothetical protein
VSSLFHVEHLGGLFGGDPADPPDWPGSTGLGLLPDKTGRDTDLFHVEHSCIRAQARPQLLLRWSED